MSETAEPEWDFFISYAPADQAWAEWIAWQLEGAGHRVLIQAWDFVPGAQWLTRMVDGVRRSKRVLAILSPDYPESAYRRQEWELAFRQGVEGSEPKVIPIRVRDCRVPDLLGGMVSFDLFGLAEDQASERLLGQVGSALMGRAKPTTAPPFPGVTRPAPAATRPAIAFPGTGPGAAETAVPHVETCAEPDSETHRTGPLGGTGGPNRRKSEATQDGTECVVPLPPIWSAARAGWRRWRIFTPVVVVSLAAIGIFLTVPLPWWAAKPGRVGVLAWHTDPVVALGVSADGNLIATGAADPEVKLWNVSKPGHPVIVGSLYAGPRDSLMSLALSPNKRFLVAGNAGLSPTVWDLSNIHNPTRAAQFDEPAGSPTATAMAFSPDGRWLLIGTDAGTTTLWDLHGWDPTRDVPPSHRTVGQRNAFPVQSVAFSANGTDFAVSTANSLLFYATADPTTERSSVDVQSRSVAAMVFTPSSLLVTADGEAKTATVWNAGDLADTEEPITVSAFASIRDHRDAVLAVALSRDGRTVATAGRDGTVVLTDVGTTDPRHLNTITVGADQINALMFVPGHNLLAIAADDNVLLWRTGS